MGERVFRIYYKGHVDKTKGEGGSGGEMWVCWGGGEWWWENADKRN